MRSLGQFDLVHFRSVLTLLIHHRSFVRANSHIMAVDEVEYDEACETFEKIAKKNREGTWLYAIPYICGIGLASGAAFAALPMVFDLNTTVWFNESYVTVERPEEQDLETTLEVGSWSWSWMEPPLGTFSFSLLCLQFSR